MDQRNKIKLYYICLISYKNLQSQGQNQQTIEKWINLCYNTKR